MAIESMHSCNIHHRDLKADNLKRKLNHKFDYVVAIDYGTAAHIDMMRIFSIYEQGFTPGSLAYSEPECEIGLSGCRELGSKTDIYALGCLLYELFNSNYLFYEVNNEAIIPVIRMAMKHELSSCKNHEEMIEKWKKIFVRYEGACIPPSIDGLGSTIPTSIIPIISKLYVKMVRFDFNDRLDDLSEGNYSEPLIIGSLGTATPTR